MKKILTIFGMLWNLLTAFCCAFAWHIPETGQDLCYNSNGPVSCPSANEPFFGQDPTYTINPLSYTKLDAEGNDLPQGAASWAMVRDNVTGLIWEVKTAADGQTNYADPHDADNHYSWYDDNPVTNGGYAGPGGPEPTTRDFIAALNQSRFGGFEDWRMPTVLEIASILNYGGFSPCVDDGFFTNMQSAGYWSSTSNAGDPQKAWRVDLSTGTDESFSKSNRYYAIAVRGGPTGAALRVNGDGTVTDTSSGLVWAQYPAKDPSGVPKTMTWQEALAYCEASMLAGFPDWRLPTVKELLSIADYSRQGPVIDQEAFPSTPGSLFWTGTTSAPDTSGAWHVDFGSGGSAYWVSKGSALYVRAVRGGKAPQPDTGSLTVVLEPEGARSSGGQWRRVGSSNWQASGTLEEALPVGQYIVEFKDAAGWETPGPVSVTVSKDQIANATATYAQIPYQFFYVSGDYPMCGGKSPCFPDIPGAMAESGGAKQIKIAQGDYGDIILASKPEALLLQGGYDSTFSSVVSFSSVGQLIIQDGNVIVENMQIGPSASLSQAVFPSIQPGSSVFLGTVKAHEEASFDSIEALWSAVKEGSPEESLLLGLGDEANAIFDGCARVGGQELLLGRVISLYKAALERPPEPWAIDMWGCYSRHLAAAEGFDQSQVLWVIACHLFESNEYAQRARGASGSLEDLFMGLYSRAPEAHESKRWLSGDWSFRQVLFGLTRCLESDKIPDGSPDGASKRPYSVMIIDLYMGLLDRFPSLGELDDALSRIDSAGSVEEALEEIIGSVMASDEFRTLEPTEVGAGRRLGLTLGAAGLNGMAVVSPEQE